MTEEQTYFVESRASPVEDIMLLKWKPPPSMQEGQLQSKVLAPLILLATP